MEELAAIRSQEGRVCAILESNAKDDLKVVYNIRTVSPGQPGYEALHARQIGALGLVLRRLAVARRSKESQEKPAQKG
jgi:hypothetical protein